MFSPQTAGRSLGTARERQRPPSGRPLESGRGAVPRALLLLDHHRLDRRGHAVLDLDYDHARADRLDRLVEVDVTAVDRDAARVLDRVGDVLRCHRSEEPAVVAGLVRDREHRLVEQRRALLGLGGGVGLGALGGDGAALGRGDRSARRGLGQLARDQVVAEITLRDVDDGALGAEVLVVGEEDGLGHRGLALAVAVAVVAPRTAALVAVLAVVADVRQERDLACALDRRGDLVLVPAAGARDAARADLAAVRDELAERRDVLVVDLVDLVAAVLAGLPAAGAGPTLLLTPARRPAALLCHWKTFRVLRVSRRPWDARSCRARGAGLS